MKMVTTFNKTDLVSFGNYLLRTQKEREASKGLTFKLMESDWSEENIQEQLKLITHADIANWKAEQDNITRRNYVVKTRQDSEFGHKIVTLEEVRGDSKLTEMPQIVLTFEPSEVCNLKEGQQYNVDFSKSK